MWRFLIINAFIAFVFLINAANSFSNGLFRSNRKLPLQNKGAIGYVPTICTSFLKQDEPRESEVYSFSKYTLFGFIYIHTLKQPILRGISQLFLSLNLYICLNLLIHTLQKQLGWNGFPLYNMFIQVYAVSTIHQTSSFS